MKNSFPVISVAVIKGLCRENPALIRGEGEFEEKIMHGIYKLIIIFHESAELMTFFHESWQS